MKQEAIFNNPKGAKADQYRIIDRLVEDINNAQAGSEIEIIVYSFGLKQVTDALSRASKRGVMVRVVCDHHLKPSYAVRLADQLNAVPGSGVHFQAGAARARHTRNTHAKTWKVRYPDGSWVVYVGSSNMTGFACKMQYQDMLRISGTKRDDTFYQWLHRLFSDQYAGRAIAKPYVHDTVANFGVWAFPFPDATAETDPVIRRLAWCSKQGYADVSIIMHALNGPRAVWIAKELCRLARAGHTVRVLYGEGTGKKVLGMLEKSQVQVRRGVWPDGKHVHHKLMMARTKSGKAAPSRYHVWTGSDNWTSDSFHQEEIVVRTWECYNDYARHFDTLWSNAR